MGKLPNCKQTIFYQMHKACDRLYELSRDLFWQPWP